MKNAERPANINTNQPLQFGQFGLASLLFLIAFAAIFIGILLLTLGSISNLGSANTGAVILIGPIPIIVGSGSYSIELIALAAALTVVALVVFLLVRRRA